MKQILRIAPLAALVLAGITLSAQATTPPDSVGDVTLYGNITANSPMWQWTVNDYPGARLDAKPSTADTSVAGKVSYPLTGQWFIAASGYLPSYVPGKIGTVNSTIGTSDITTLTSPDGPVVLTNTGTTATVSIPAAGTDASGTAITGTLVLNADELRGTVYKYTNVSGSTIGGAFLHYTNGPVAAVAGGSCWVGRGTDTVGNLTKTQTSNTLPVFTDAGPNGASGAAGAVNSAFATADSAGVVRYNTVGLSAAIASTTYTAMGCSEGSSSAGILMDTTVVGTSLVPMYKSAAHVLALQPTSLSFPKAASGAWNATLTVTAYQM